MLLKTKGIIIKAIKYSETSIITDVYTEEKGLRTYIVSGVRSKRSKISSSLLQIMSLVDMVVYHSNHKDISRTKEIRPAHVYASIPFDIRKGAVGTFITEIIQKTIKEQEENKELFDFLFHTFLLLDKTDKSVSNFHLVFLVHLTSYLGFQPSGTYSKENSYFDMQEGIFTNNPGNLLFMEVDQSKALDTLMKTKLEDSHHLSFKKSERSELIHQLLNFYKIHVENFTSIQSNSILEAVFIG